MNNWPLLEESIYKQAWDCIYQTLNFSPNNGWNTLVTLPYPQVAWNIESFYDDGFREDLYEDLHSKALNVMRECVGPDQEILALSWQHECCRFNPWLPIDLDDFGEWLIPVFPNGEYAFFLKQDFSNGIICDGISFVLATYGDAFVSALNQQLPNMLQIAPIVG